MNSGSIQRVHNAEEVCLSACPAGAWQAIQDKAQLAGKGYSLGKSCNAVLNGLPSSEILHFEVSRV